MEQKKKKILIVDDTELNRSILSDMLSPEYEILEAATGTEAIAALCHYYADLSLVLLDIVMPGMDGFEVLAVMNRNDWLRNLPVIMISAENSSTYIDHAYDLGATDYITRPFDERTVCRRVQNTIVLYAKQKTLENMVAEQIMEKERNSSQMVEILSNIVEFRNGESGLHVLHIRIITDVLLQSLRRRCPEYELTSAKIALIANASALHDIGKISIDEKILNKPGRLTEEEYEIMKTHTIIGAQILERAPHSKENTLVQTAHQICRWHHERYDGRGYPDGLKGNEIPIAAQVVSLADVYDALTSKRVYKEAYSHEKAVDMILNGECGAFNPVLLDCLVENGETLSRNLTIRSPQTVSNMEMQRVASELMSHSELRASGRTLALLEQERTKYRFYASMTQEILIEYDRDTQLIEFSEWGAKFLGVPEIVSMTEECKKLPVWCQEFFEDVEEHLQKTTPENPVTSKNYCLPIQGGEPRWFRLVARTLWDDGESSSFSKAIGKLIDIHDNQVKIAQLQDLAKRDTLTGLYNHGGAQEMVEELLKNWEGKKSLMIALDLDYLKVANDTYGHIFGDNVLKHVADNIRQSIRKEDIAGRIGGDEFLIFLQYTTHAETLVKRIFQNVCTPYEEYPISVSMGMALCPENGTEYMELFRRADMALYTAKNNGKNQYCFYDASMAETLSARTPIDPAVSSQN